MAANTGQAGPDDRWLAMLQEEVLEPELPIIDPVAGELIVIAKYAIKSQTCSELAVTYHPSNEGNQHPPRSTD